jgi:hypothetical protein
LRRRHHHDALWAGITSRSEANSAASCWAKAARLEEATAPVAVVGDADIRLVRQEISLPSTSRAAKIQGRSVDARGRRQRSAQAEMPYVLATGRPPRPPAAFDSAHASAEDFDPPLKKEAPKKVLASGHPPRPPPSFDPSKSSSSKFNPPLAGTAKPPAPVYKTVPKVLADGRLPQPPAALSPADASTMAFDPPVSNGS